MLTCCSSKPRKGKRRAEGQRHARAARSRPGMQAEELPPPMQPAGDPVVPKPVVSTTDDTPAAHPDVRTLVTPSIPAYSPEETLTPAVVTRPDEVEVRLVDQATDVPATWTATQPVALGEYEADRAEILGNGSFGVVVRGVELLTGTRVAVKLLPMPAQTHEDFDSARREAAIGGALQHQNIAQIFASVYREDDTAPLETMEGRKPCTSGTLYLVQELAAGRDMFWLWWETRPSRCLTEDRARFFASQLLDAMAYLQSVGICHRDLKLQNLLLNADQNTLKLSDFGTAVTGGMTNAAGVGTPCMWAPELWLANECDGHKLDMWACGLMIFQLVAGALPFDDIDFEQELDPQRLMFMSDTISEFGRQVGSAATGEAGPPMPASSPDLVFSTELWQLLGGLLQPEPGPRLSAVDAMQQGWCHMEYSASTARTKAATYEANSVEVRSAIDKRLRAGDPNQWAGRREPGAILTADHSVVSALAPRAKPASTDEIEGGEDELDAVQAEIAKLKAEMGL